MRELKRPKEEDYLFNQTVKHMSDLNTYIDQLESKLKAVEDKLKTPIDKLTLLFNYLEHKEDEEGALATEIIIDELKKQ